MKYCNTCGNLNYDRARRCSVCSTGFKKKDRHIDYTMEEHIPFIEEYSKKSVFTSPSKIGSNYLPTPKKKNLLFIFPFFFIPGIGHIYAGKWKKGLYLLGAFIIVVIVDVVTKVLGFWVIIGVTTPAYLILIIWGIIGSIKLIKAHNEEVEGYYQKQQK